MKKSFEIPEIELISLPNDIETISTSGEMKDEWAGEEKGEW